MKSRSLGERYPMGGRLSGSSRSKSGSESREREAKAAWASGVGTRVGRRLSGAEVLGSPAEASRASTG